MIDDHSIRDQEDFDTLPLGAKALSYSERTDRALLLQALDTHPGIDTLVVGDVPPPGELMPRLSGIKALHFRFSPPDIVNAWMQLPGVGAINLG